MSVFSIDKRISRTLFLDNWTRELEVSIPVIEIDKWNGVKEKLNEIFIMSNQTQRFTLTH